MTGVDPIPWSAPDFVVSPELGRTRLYFVAVVVVVRFCLRAGDGLSRRAVDGGKREGRLAGC
jgi:hypothetical protein